MRVERVVSSLEMTSRAQLLASAPVHGVSLYPWSGPTTELRSVHDEIALPHRWPSLAWSQDAWEERIADPLVRWFAIRVDDRVAGLVEMETQRGGHVEITIFGLRPEYQGRGLGGIALTLAVQAAWGTGRGGDTSVARVWLHTTTRDGPRALANYLSRGFRVFATETKTEEVADPS